VSTSGTHADYWEKRNEVRWDLELQNYVRDLQPVVKSKRAVLPAVSISNRLVRQLFYDDQQWEVYMYTLPADTLEKVMLAFFGRQLDPATCKGALLQLMSLAVSSLSFRVSFRPKHIGDREVFAANLLGWVAYSTCSYGADAYVHFSGSLAMLTFLMDPKQLNQQSLSSDLATFGPFIMDCANAWTTRNGGIPQRLTSFGQRVKYFDQLFGSDNPGIWHCGTLEAANATLGNLMEITLRVVSEFARNEEEESASRSRADEVVQYVRAELGDADLHAGLMTIYRSFQGELTNHATVEGQLITRVFHRLRCVLLLLAILEQPSIQVGVSTAKAQYLGKVVISFCRKQAIRRNGPIEDYYLISWHNFSHLLLGGMCLTMEDYPESKLLIGYD